MAQILACKWQMSALVVGGSLTPVGTTPSARRDSDGLSIPSAAQVPVGNRSYPDGQSALMVVAARLRHIAGSKWGTRRYLDMDGLDEPREAGDALT